MRDPAYLGAILRVAKTAQAAVTVSAHVYEDVVDLFNQGDDEFTWHYAMMVHDIMWDHVVEKELASADPQHRAKWNDLNKRLGKERSSSSIHGLRGRTAFIRNT